MYVPAAFQETDLPTLHAFIERHSFGLLASQLDGAPFATHLPLLLDRAAGPRGTVLGHLARANPQWRELAGRTALAVFSGPHAYVSPSWYEADRVVPTWNYAAVHVYGTVELIEDPAGLLDVVRRSVDVYESGSPRPWALGERDGFLDRLLRQIVGFRLAVDRIEGKWKMSQNQPVERRLKVAAALDAQGGEAAAVAALVRERLPAAPP